MPIPFNPPKKLGYRKIASKIVLLLIIHINLIQILFVVTVFEIIFFLSTIEQHKVVMYV